MKAKRLFLACFYIVIGFVCFKGATTFDKLGVTNTSGTGSEPTPHPNWETKS